MKMALVLLCASIRTSQVLALAAFHSSSTLRYTNAVEVPLATDTPLPPLRKESKVQKGASDESSKGNFYLHRQEVLSKLSMLPKVSHSKGSYLYLDDGTQVLDCLAQYGAVPLGHNNEEINSAMIDYVASNQAVFVQPFMAETTKELSRKLCYLANQGLPQESTNAYEYVTFSNSGAEAVEAAMKLSRTKTRRSKILSVTDSFHGKTMGSLSATGSKRYSNEYIVCDKNFDKVVLNDVEALSKALASKEYAAFIVEPIQGEGGMIPADIEYLRQAQELCAKHGTMLVFDEIQTGLGRTGSMFAKDHSKVQPDVLLLSKALGGGSYPIGAMITKRKSYSQEFDRKHSSTFAGSGLGSAVALKTLDIIENSQVLQNVRRREKQIENGLSRLQEKFPGILSFDGKGLMWAIHFQDPGKDTVGNGFINQLATTALSYIVCGFLLNEKRLLCMPFLGKVGSVRFEPSLTINSFETNAFLNAIEDVCKILKNQRHDILLSYLIQRPISTYNIGEEFPLIPLSNPTQPALQEGDSRRKLAFLVHYLGEEDTKKQLPPAVKHFWSDEDQRKLSKFFIDVGALQPEAAVVQDITMTSAVGETVNGLLINTPLTPEKMMKMSKREKEEIMSGYLQVAQAHGVDSIIGLGAFTSVVTRGGTQFLNDEQSFTSGNSFTALASAESLKQHASAKGVMLDMGVAVIGGKGSVGRLAMMELMQHFGQINVVGNPRSSVAELEEVVGNCIVEMIENDYDATCDRSSGLGKIVALLEKSETGLVKGGRALIEHLRDLAVLHDMELPLTITSHVADVVDSTNYVLSATSEGKPFLSSNTFRPNTVVFDLARPFDFEATPDCNIEVFEGGLVTQPQKILWGDVNIAHHPAGINLACLSETVALAMEGVTKSYSIGNRIPFTEAKEVYDICLKHGFAPLSYTNQNQLAP